ncbi:hypothetical protein BH11MYX1_BH11MYX1_43120 [soil metagenome]
MAIYRDPSWARAATHRFKRSWLGAARCFASAGKSHGRINSPRSAAIADFAVYAYTHLAGDLSLELGVNIARWCRRIEALPGYVAGPGPYDSLAMVR